MPHADSRLLYIFKSKLIPGKIDSTVVPGKIGITIETATLDRRCSFNYTFFWESTLRLALNNSKHDRSSLPASSPCPKVYIYDLPKELRDVPVENSIEKVFGHKSVAQGKYHLYSFPQYSAQYMFPAILEHRLRNSKECRTHDPNHADLFFVPIFSGPKSGSEWKALCKNNHTETLLSAMAHLNETNACRHVFAIGKGHYIAKLCSGWFSNPVKALAPALRLAYSHFDFYKDKSTGKHSRLKPDLDTKSQYPNLISVPYPSSVHFSKDMNISDLPQFNQWQDREHLMSFIGSTSHGDKQVRGKINATCCLYNDTKICDLVGVTHAHYGDEKSKAIFCLEPAGDSPWRKGISDSITMGCIPVLFSDLTDDVAPFHWGNWKDSGRVLVPRAQFASGCIDLKGLLQSAPPMLVQLMQQTLAKHARTFQYSINDDQKDGIRIILDSLYHRALQGCSS